MFPAGVCCVTFQRGFGPWGCLSRCVFNVRVVICECPSRGKKGWVGGVIVTNKSGEVDYLTRLLFGDKCSFTSCTMGNNLAGSRFLYCLHRGGGVLLVLPLPMDHSGVRLGANGTFRSIELSRVNRYLKGDSAMTKKVVSSDHAILSTGNAGMCSCCSRRFVASGTHLATRYLGFILGRGKVCSFDNGGATVAKCNEATGTVTRFVGRGNTGMLVATESPRTLTSTMGGKCDVYLLESCSYVTRSTSVLVGAIPTRVVSGGVLDQLEGSILLVSVTSPPFKISVKLTSSCKVGTIETLKLPKGCTPRRTNELVFGGTRPLLWKKGGYTRLEVYGIQFILCIWGNSPSCNWTWGQQIWHDTRGI